MTTYSQRAPFYNAITTVTVYPWPRAQNKAAQASRGPGCCYGLAKLILRSSLCSAGGRNAVCNSAGTVDEASDRKLRFAIYIQATQVTRYACSEETRESAVFQVDTDPAVAGDCRTQKHRLAAEEFNAIATVATDGTAPECQGSTRVNANTVVVKLGIEGFEVSRI